MASQLVQLTACGQITVISGNDITVASLPSTFQLGVELDIASASPASTS
jgi:hypothetical protein